MRERSRNVSRATEGRFRIYSSSHRYFRYFWLFHPSTVSPARSSDAQREGGMLDEFKKFALRGMLGR
jgi:hypothetical protein